VNCSACKENGPLINLQNLYNTGNRSAWMVYLLYIPNHRFILVKIGILSMPIVASAFCCGYRVQKHLTLKFLALSLVSVPISISRLLPWLKGTVPEYLCFPLSSYTVHRTGISVLRLLVLVTMTLIETFSPYSTELVVFKESLTESIRCSRREGMLWFDDA